MRRLIRTAVAAATAVAATTGCTASTADAAGAAGAPEPTWATAGSFDLQAHRGGAALTVENTLAAFSGLSTSASAPWSSTRRSPRTGTPW
jgi:glycerophosphoryl diester phosphodiesterase